MPASPSFGEWLKQRRRTLDLTQHALAQQIGYSTWTIVKIEAGARRPSKQIMERLAETLRVPSVEREVFYAFARGVALPDAPAPPALTFRAPDLPLRTNLPASPNAFIGREKERAILHALLRRPGMRLLTLTGPAGVGKTRLALEAASDLLPSFPGGVTLVALAPIRDPALVLPTLAVALGIRERPDEPLLAAVHATLARHSHLLLLDNFEQVLAAAPLLADLLAAAAGVKILVTSRTRLHLYGEHELVVPPLPLPDPQAVLTVMQARAYAGVALFAARALAARADFVLTAENVAAVVQLCHRLDGLPLALELAAARIRRLSPDAIVQRFTLHAGALPLLIDGPHNLPARQRTLRAAIAWSYDLLAPSEQQLFRRLAVFVQGWTLEVAAAVAHPEAATTEEPPAPEPPDASSAGLMALVAQSLVGVTVDTAGNERYTMLETIREFGLECLAGTGEEDATRARHAAAYLVLAEAAVPALHSPGQGAWLDRLEQEHANLRAALRWLLAAGGVAQAGRLAGALAPFWLARGYISEGRHWLAQALALSLPAPVRALALHGAGMLAVRQGDCATAQTLLRQSLDLYTGAGDPAGQAQALDGLGTVATRQSDYPAAHRLYEASLALYRAGGDGAGMARTLASLGEVARCQGHYAQAAPLYNESLALYRQVADPGGIARSLVDLGNISLIQAHYAAAQALYKESLALFERLGDTWGRARVVNNLGEVARHTGDLARARTCYEQSIALFRAAEGPAGVAGALANLAYVVFQAGDAPAAARLYDESLAILRTIGDRNLSAVCLTGLAGVAAVQAQPRRAARLFGAAAALLETLGAGGDQAVDTDRTDYERLVAAARTQLDSETFAACWQEGRRLVWAAAVGYALGEFALP